MVYIFRFDIFPKFGLDKLALLDLGIWGLGDLETWGLGANCLIGVDLSDSLGKLRDK